MTSTTQQKNTSCVHADISSWFFGFPREGRRRRKSLADAHLGTLCNTRVLIGLIINQAFGLAYACLRLPNPRQNGGGAHLRTYEHCKSAL